MNVKKITLIGTLSAIGAILRIPFAIIPSLQPTTFIVAISGYVFGVRAGILVGILSALISNMFLGQGLWTIMQMFAWGLVGLSFGLMGKVRGRTFTEGEKWRFAIVLFLWGYVFSWILNIWHWFTVSAELNLGTFIGINAISFFPFDTTHAMGNLFFALFFGRDFIRILDRYRSKIS
jgi:energy-coupling factor transport system substrate-specific component